MGSSAHELTGKDENLLSVEHLNVFYGGIQALYDVSLNIRKGEILSIIGSNGAGKSSLLRTIAGDKSIDSGSITFQGEQLPKSSYEVVGKGISLVPEGRRIFPNLSVKDNLAIGAYNRRKDKEGIKESLEEVLDLFPRLKERYHQLGGTLSGGEQQKAAFAKILLTEPKIILLDEPTKGIDAFSKNTLAGILYQLKEKGITVIIVTHDVEFAAEHADRCAMFFDGQIVSVANPVEFFASNSYYTTAASRISRGLYQNAVTVDMVVELCRKNGKKQSGEPQSEANNG